MERSASSRSWAVGGTGLDRQRQSRYRMTQAARTRPPRPSCAASSSSTTTPSRARLYVTSLGLHEVRINGQRVGQDLLAPGWTSYRHRVLAETYDVTPLLTPGRNVVGATLADGWYRGRLGWPVGRTDAAMVRSSVSCPARGGGLRSADDRGQRRLVAREHRGGSIRRLVRRDRHGLSETQDRMGPRRIRRFVLAAGPRGRLRCAPCRAAHGRAGTGRGDGRPMSMTVTERGSGSTAARTSRGMSDYGSRGRPGSASPSDTPKTWKPRRLALHAGAAIGARATDEYVLADSGETVLEPPFTFHGFRCRSPPNHAGARGRRDRDQQRPAPAVRSRAPTSG